jgi:AraC-like DNA-binding protein
MGRPENQEFTSMSTRLPTNDKCDEPAYGDQMAKYFHLDGANVVKGATQRGASIAITRLSSEAGMCEPSAPIPAEKAFVAALQLRDLTNHELWIQGRRAPVGFWPKGSVSIVDLEQEPVSFMPEPFDVLHFYVPRAALDELADENALARIETLSWPAGATDPIAYNLGLVALAMLEQREPPNRLFLDHLVFAITTHFAHTYGQMQLGSPATRGGLARWQARRSIEMMLDNIEHNVSLARLAKECRLSPSHFARAFKQTLGRSPHRWLLERRVEKAKGMLIGRETPISEIALGAGFADQAHFTRVFSKLTGTTPGAWRRAVAA